MKFCKTLFVSIALMALCACNNVVKSAKSESKTTDADSQNSLGVAYANGRGVQQDLAEAVKWWRKAAEQGHAAAQFNLGVAYDNGLGVIKDPVEAVSIEAASAKLSSVGIHAALAGGFGLYPYG